MNKMKDEREIPQPDCDLIFIVLHTLFYISMLKKNILREDIENKELLKFELKF